jgi:Fur family ferric uptake transcriptional regulator
VAKPDNEYEKIWIKKMSGKKSDLHSSSHLNELIQNLRESGLRVTEPRIAILRALLEKHGPFTVEEIHIHVTKKVCDLATIYRTLGSLEKTGLIKRCEFGDGSARYELAGHENHHHHHHVICKKCRKVEVLDDCELEEIDSFAKKRGFTDISHSLEFFGICPNCKK